MASRTLPELFDERVASSGDRVALRGRAEGAWRQVTWTEWQRAALKLGAGLVSLGVQAGDRVALLSSTRVEWVFADMAIVSVGAVNVPLPETTLPQQLRLVLEHCGARVVVVEDPVQLAKIIAIRDQIPAVRHVIYIDESGTAQPSVRGDAPSVLRLEDVPRYDPHDGWVLGLPRLRELGSAALAANPNTVLDRLRAIGPDDLASIAYTSGTTGRPRGVMLSHRNYVAAVEGNALTLDASEADTQLLFLPLSHTFGRIAYLTAIRTGATTALVRGVGRLAGDLKEIRPTILVGVPRVYERAWHGIFDELQRAGGMRERAIRAARDVATAWSREVCSGRKPGWRLTIQHTLADGTVYRRLREYFGGRLRFAVSAGSPLSIEFAHALHGCGVTVLEGYGLTESCASACLNRLDRFRFGTVGQPLPQVEVHFASDGELLIRSPFVMCGYWDDPAATALAIEDGWLRTGDIGERDEGFIRVTGRKKDLVMTAGGRSIAPQPIEAALRASVYIEQAVVHGEGRPWLVALVTLDRAALETWANARGLNVAEVRNDDPRVFELVRAEIDEANRALPPHEQVRRFAILDDPFDTASGEVTEAGSARRRFVAEKYRRVIDGLYDGVVPGR